MKAVYLYPQGSYQTPLRSDTLWGILCWGIHTLYGEQELENMLASSQTDDPEFTISSTMPFCETVKGNETIRHRFYPVPYNISAQKDISPKSDSKADKLEAHQIRKQVKKVKYLTEADFQKALDGKLKKEDLLASATEEFQPSIASTVVTHNTIDRTQLSTLQKKDSEGNESGQLFHNEEFFVNMAGKPDARAGLFFLVKGNTEKIEAVMRYYRHKGIGANSSAGKGVFDCKIEDFTGFSAAPEGDALLNLSLYHPQQSEQTVFDFKSKKSAYLIETRGGKVGQHLVKQDKAKVPCIKEGSVLSVIDDKAEQKKYGKILCENYPKIPHPIYRNYLGFMVKMKSC